MVRAADALNSRWRPAKHQARLAQAAAVGDSRAIASLLSRYEQRAFDLAYRITGSTDHAAEVTQDAFLAAVLGKPRPAGRDFGSSLFSAVCGMLVDDQQETEELSEADLGLPPRCLAALALRELEGMSYQEIAEVLGTDRDYVAVLISSARLGLQEERLEPLGAADGTSTECERSPPLIAMRDDAQLDDEDDAVWLLAHLAHCAGCRLRLDAMQAARASYRESATPAVPPPWLFERTIARAAELTGGQSNAASGRPAAGHTDRVPADEGAIGPARPARTDKGAGGSPRPGGTDDGRRERPRTGRAIAGTAGAGLAALRESTAARTAALRRHPRRNPLVSGGLALLALMGVSGVAAGGTLILRGDGDPPAPAEPAVAQGSAPSPGPPAAPKPVEGKRKARKAPAAVPTTTAPQGVVILTPRPAARTRPDSTPRRPRTPRRKRSVRRTPPAATVPDPQPAPPVAQPAPTVPPAAPSPVPTPPQPAACTDGTGLPVPCPG